MIFHRALVSRASLAMLTLGLTGFAIGLFVASCTSSPVCSAGLSRCGLGCADFKSDVHNCGGCNLSCQTHQICQAGQCLCQSGTILCGGACVLPSSDPQNCGGCAGTDAGVACTAMQVCETGQCRAQCTLPGLTACARACVDVSVDPDNCGGCALADGGFTCSLDGGVDGGPQVCDTGQCRAQCGSGRLACNRSCINPMTDRNNCGRCGNACDNARSCHSGNCIYDVVAACFNTGQVVGIQGGTDLIGPLSSIGSNPQALGADLNVLLVADGIDRKLRQARLSDLSPLDGGTDLGASPNHILVDDPYIYIVNSLGDTLQILQRGSIDAGTDPDAGLQLATVGQLNFGSNTSPQAIAKIGDDLYIPLYGAFNGAGAGLVHVDVRNPAAPIQRETISFNGIDLRSFDGGTTYARPAGVAVHRGLLYVTLSNLTPTYRPGGPGIVARVDRDAGTATPIYLGDVCLNTFWVQSGGNILFVSCSGRIGFDRPAPYPVEQSAVLAIDTQDRLASSWSASCGSTTNCTPPSAGRFSRFGDRLYVGDNLSGRVFVVQVVAQDAGTQLVERRGYTSVDGTPPLMACPTDPTTQQAYVSDMISVP